MTPEGLEAIETYRAGGRQIQAGLPLLLLLLISQSVITAVLLSFLGSTIESSGARLMVAGFWPMTLIFAIKLMSLVNFRPAPGMRSTTLQAKD